MTPLTPLTAIIAAAAVPPGAAAQAATLSIWDFMIKGGVLMIPIGLCSLVVLAVVVERLLVLRRSRVNPPGFLQGVRAAFTTGGADEALRYCKSSGSAIGAILAAGLRRAGAPEQVIEKQIADAGEREITLLRKRLRALSVIAAVAPLLGLLGTIFGMIKAFQTVAVSGEALGRTELLAGGIYEAMVTTAAGLIVAIPALISYHWLAAKVDRLVADMDHLCVEFLESDVLTTPHAPARPTRAPHAPEEASSNHRIPVAAVGATA
jgi:biopolymer transport protein ExbB